MVFALEVCEQVSGSVFCSLVLSVNSASSSALVCIPGSLSEEREAVFLPLLWQLAIAWEQRLFRC